MAAGMNRAPGPTCLPTIAHAEDNGYTARCSRHGWVSDWKPTYRQARLSGAAHKRAKRRRTGGA